MDKVFLKKWILVLGGLGFTTYTSYQIYNLPCIVKKRQRLSKFLGALLSIAEMISDSSQAMGIVSKDLKEFLASDSDQIPQSLKQISKIAKSPEFSDSLSVITRALTVGTLQGYQNGNDPDPAFYEKVMDKLFSDKGSGFTCVVVGSFARNLVMGLYSEWQKDRNGDVEKLVEIIKEEKCREIIGECVQLFVSTAVSVYLDKTMSINTYDEIMSGLTNPKHEGRVKDMLVTICNGGVESFIRTSYNVWWSRNDGFVPRKKAVSMDKRKTTKLVADMVRSFLDFVVDNVLQRSGVSVDGEAMRFVSSKSAAVTTLCLNILNSPWILAPHHFS